MAETRSSKRAGTDAALDAEVQRLGLEIVKRRQRPLLIWTGLRQEIDRACFYRVKQALRDVGELSQLDVLIHSRGGDINDAYRCLRCIRRHARAVTVIVPFIAKSAATFVAVGGDEILIGVDGELGPLDAQVADPAGSLHGVSALNEFKSLEAIRDFALQTLDLMVEHLMEKADMDIPYALDRAQQVAAEFAGPLYNQVRPRDLGRFSRHLAVGEAYALRVMTRWGYADRRREDVEKIVGYLVSGYPAHDYIIDLDEAKAIGLKARELDPVVDDLGWQLVQRPDPVIAFVPLAGGVTTQVNDGGDATKRRPESAATRRAPRMETLKEATDAERS
jgi:hypothetical protein